MDTTIPDVLIRMLIGISTPIGREICASLEDPTSFVDLKYCKVVGKINQSNRDTILSIIKAIQ
jgi:hypothetical protein